MPLHRTRFTLLATSSAMFICLWLVYGLTAAPEVTFHDSGELITAAYTLGLPHPPGSPLWCLIGHGFTYLPVGSPAFRIHLMSGFFAAATCVGVFLFTYLWSGEIKPRPSKAMRLISGIFAGLILAQTPGLWEKAVQAELYTLNAFLIVVLLLIYVRWRSAGASGDDRSWRFLALMAFVLGAGSGNHMALFYNIPVFGIAILIHNPSIIRQFRVIIYSAMAFVLGLTVFAYLPVRSRANPPIDWGNPETWTTFIEVLRRQEWGALSFSKESLYFMSKWIASYDLLDQLWLVPGLLAVWGYVYATVKNKNHTQVLLWCLLANSGFMMLMQATTFVNKTNLYYMHHYGFSEYHIPVYLILAIFGGIGIVILLSRVDWKKRSSVHGAWIRVSAICVVLAIPVHGLVHHYQRCDLSQYTQPYRFGLDLFDQIPRDGWFIPSGDDQLFISIYLKYCKELRPDIFLVTGPSRYPKRLAGGEQDYEQFIVSSIRLSPEEYLKPVLNQNNLNATPNPKVVFGYFPDDHGFARSLYPDGLLFKFGSEASYDPEAQLAFWHSFLQKDYVVLTRRTKDDFRNTMIGLFFDHARFHFMIGEHETSVFLYKKAREYARKPRADIEAALGKCHFHLGNLDVAFRHCQKALEIDATSKLALVTTAEILLTAGKHDMAKEFINHALAIDPNDAGLKALLLHQRRNPEQNDDREHINSPKDDSDELED